MSLLRGFNPERIRESRDRAIRVARTYGNKMPKIYRAVAVQEARLHNSLLVKVLKAKKQ